MPRMFGKNENFKFHRSPGAHRKDPQTSRFVGGETQTTLRAVGSTSRRPPKAKTPQMNIHVDYSDSQLPPSEEHLYFDVEYPVVIGKAASSKF